MSSTPPPAIPTAIQAVIDRIDRQGDTALLPGRDTPLDRFGDLLRRLFPEYGVLNLTDFQYGRSWQYLIALSSHPDAVALDRVPHARAVQAAGGIESVFLDLSAVAPYVLFRFVRYQPAGDRALARWSDVPLSAAQETLLQQLMVHLAAEGFTRLEQRVADLPVPDVTTELCDEGDATVGSCLFYG